MTNTQDYNQSNQNKNDAPLIDQLTGKPLESEILPASELPSEIAGTTIDNPGASEAEITDLNATAKSDVELPDDTEAKFDKDNSAISE